MIYGFSIWFLIGCLLALISLAWAIWLISIVYRQTQMEKEQKRRAAPVIKVPQQNREPRKMNAFLQEDKIVEETTDSFFSDQDDIFSPSDSPQEDNQFNTPHVDDTPQLRPRPARSSAPIFEDMWEDDSKR